jgi:3-deoxy-D-manno-octulosonate 8-phosphate phosphatase (KDO 8-P phosphatase)
MLMAAGIQAGIVTGRTSNALYYRCKNLGITHIYDGVRDKAAVLKFILAQTEIAADEIAFVGDDLPDLPIMRCVGLPIAVADAHETVLAKSAMVTSAKGGTGAIREICEMILKAQGLWGKIEEKF